MVHFSSRRNNNSLWMAGLKSSLMRLSVLDLFWFEILRFQQEWLLIWAIALCSTNLPNLQEPYPLSPSLTHYSLPSFHTHVFTVLFYQKISSSLSFRINSPNSSRKGPTGCLDLVVFVANLWSFLGLQKSLTSLHVHSFLFKYCVVSFKPCER